MATDSLKQYKVEATQMSTHRPDKPEQIYRMEDGGAAGSGGMSFTWTCGETGTKGKKNTKGRNMYAACWCLSRKGNRRAYPDLHMYECSQGKPVMLSSATHGILWDKGETEGRWDKGYTSCYCLWVPKFTHTHKKTNPKGYLRLEIGEGILSQCHWDWCHCRRGLKELLYFF